ncbi:MAG: leucyl/phenylalanyl-tRNA--protein transferase [Pseudomonadota bacterium]
MPVTLLDPHRVGFPDPQLAEEEPDGLLAVGGALNSDWLLTAYAMGIFPWFNDDHDEILWWSPAQRAVLQPGEMKVRRSLAKRIRNAGFNVKMDVDFAQVIKACAAIRAGSEGTWITPRMQSAYIDLHEAGFAHSVGVYQDEELVGGLYGISLGHMFFGESMFSRVSDASKVALYHLQRQLCAWNFSLIDCQMRNPHLSRLGVVEIPRAHFLDLLKDNDIAATRLAPWRFLDT